MKNNTINFDKNSSQLIQTQQQQLRIKIIPKTSEPEIFIRFETNGRGGGKRARFHKVREIYVDPENQIHAGYKPTKEADQPYQYAVIGKLQVLTEGGGF